MHYFTSDMADQPDHRSEEALSFRTCRRCLAKRRWRRWRGSATRSALTMPASISGWRSGDLLLFEANATMVIAVPDSDERWAYRRTAISGIIDAVVAMIMQKSAAARRTRAGRERPTSRQPGVLFRRSVTGRKRSSGAWPAAGLG